MSSAPVHKGCPPKANPGGACIEPDRQCSYGAKTSCACLSSRCVTAAGPVPNCEETLLWQCRDDGCPVTTRGACKREGQKCLFDDGMCASYAACKSGRWARVPGGPGCRPAARPQP